MARGEGAGRAASGRQVESRVPLEAAREGAHLGRAVTRWGVGHGDGGGGRRQRDETCRAEEDEPAAGRRRGRGGPQHVAEPGRRRRRLGEHPRQRRTGLPGDDPAQQLHEGSDVVGRRVPARW
jgi:hypothetical protein